MQPDADTEEGRACRAPARRQPRIHLHLALFGLHSIVTQHRTALPCSFPRDSSCAHVACAEAEAGACHHPLAARVGARGSLAASVSLSLYLTEPRRNVTERNRCCLSIAPPSSPSPTQEGRCRCCCLPWRQPTASALHCSLSAARSRSPAVQRARQCRVAPLFDQHSHSPPLSSSRAAERAAATLQLCGSTHLRPPSSSPTTLHIPTLPLSASWLLVHSLELPSSPCPPSPPLPPPCSVASRFRPYASVCCTT